MTNTDINMEPCREFAWVGNGESIANKAWELDQILATPKVQRIIIAKWTFLENLFGCGRFTIDICPDNASQSGDQIPCAIWTCSTATEDQRKTVQRKLDQLSVGFNIGPAHTRQPRNPGDDYAFIFVGQDHVAALAAMAHRWQARMEDDVAKVWCGDSGIGDSASMRTALENCRELASLAQGRLPDRLMTPSRPPLEAASGKNLQTLGPPNQLGWGQRLRKFVLG
ncbi:MAG: hypothetical protein ABTQ34_07250 [Bdellovibrionales bacterium]